MIESNALRAETPTPREPNRYMLGRYEVLSEVGSGGAGIVYLGRLQGVGGFERLFAIKVLHRHLAREPQVVNMLLDEARLAALVHHPNVVSTVDADVSQSGEYYVVMEHVDGFTLANVIEHPSLEAQRRVRLGVRILLDAIAGIDAAHRLVDPSDGKPLHLVHRDVSTDNILVSLEGVGMIADFGVARATARSTLSLPGVIKGTPCYMAPEQACGSDDIDARADVFSLGAVLWEILAGSQLFHSPSGVVGVIGRVLMEKIEPPHTRNPMVPAALEAVCLKALERDVTQRYQSAREMGAELERAAREHGLYATTHELAEALAKLFAEHITYRRESLLQVMNERQSGEVDKLVPGVLASESASETPPSATPTAPLRASAVSEPAPRAIPVGTQLVRRPPVPLVPARRGWWRKPGWQLVAAACVLIGLFTGLGSSSPSETPRKAQARATKPAVASAARVAPTPQPAPALAIAMASPEPASTTPAAAEPVAAPLKLAHGKAIKMRALIRAPTAATVGPAAPPDQVRTSGGDVAEDDDQTNSRPALALDVKRAPKRSVVLEANPYLMQ